MEYLELVRTTTALGHDGHGGIEKTYFMCLTRWTCKPPRLETGPSPWSTTQHRIPRNSAASSWPHVDFFSHGMLCMHIQTFKPRPADDGEYTKAGLLVLFTA